MRRRGGSTSASDCITWWIKLGYSASMFSVAIDASRGTNEGDRRPAQGRGTAATPVATTTASIAASVAAIAGGTTQRAIAIVLIAVR